MVDHYHMEYFMSFLMGLNDSYAQVSNSTHKQSVLSYLTGGTSENY